MGVRSLQGSVQRRVARASRRLRDGVKRHPNYYDEESRKQLTCEHAIGYYEQKRELVEIKEERPEYQDIASHVLQDVILRLNRAFDGFFRRRRNGQRPGSPGSKARNRCDSF